MTGSDIFRTTTYHGQSLRLPVYLDHHATTPLDPKVLGAMRPMLEWAFGNPHSASHAYGWRAAQAVEGARAQIATLIGARPDDLVFTSGATEANNLAIQGVASRSRAAARPTRPGHVITCVTEHPCVRATCRALRDQGFAVTELPVDGGGLVALDRLEAELRDDTLLVSIMAANHEIGVLQPIAAIAALCRPRGILVHTDAAQALGKVPLDVRALGVDLMSLSAHKIYGPQGVGALYVRPGVEIAPLLSGGGQERGLRAGTVPTALVVGFGAACALAEDLMAAEAVRLGVLRDRWFGVVREALPDIRLNGAATPRLPHNLNVCLPGVDAEDLLADLPDLALATGAACASADRRPSPVLRALGLSDAEIQGSVRIGLGRTTTDVEVDFAADRLVAAVRRLR